MSDQAPALEMSCSPHFPSWLVAQNVSLAFTTYQAGKLFLIGVQDDGHLSVFERTFNRCMGLGAAADGGFWMSSLFQLWRFANFLEPGATQDGYDALYAPITGYTTGDVDIHDIHDRPGNGPVFVVTRFNCLATTSASGSFRPLWRPPFIDAIVAEDRCHLNGLALRNGTPAFVTCVGQSNTSDGWRAHRRDGGLVLDLESGEAVAAGLSMPHSPRWHNGQLWVIQSGTGEFGRIDLSTGAFEAACFLPGFARGISFVDDYAVIGVSRARENRTFEGLVLNERLSAEGTAPACQLVVVNLLTGKAEHQLAITGVVEELYDVMSLPGITRPMALGFRSDEIKFAIKPEL